MADFTSQVSAWVRETEARMAAVFRESAQRVISDMQGRVPVDTGFLKSSLQVSTTAPVPADRSPDAGGVAAYNPTAATLAIAGAEIGDTLFASYSAVYAPRINYGFVGTDALGRTYNQAGRHFVELAAQRWPAIVAQVSGEAQARAGGAR